MKQVLICGIPFERRYANDSRLVDQDFNPRRLNGLINYEQHSITILSKNPVEAQRQTLMHEILHGVVDSLAIRELVGENGDHIEAPIKQLATGICEALESLGLVLPDSESDKAE